jgi:hypothetical protein
MLHFHHQSLFAISSQPLQHAFHAFFQAGGWWRYAALARGFVGEDVREGVHGNERCGEVAEEGERGGRVGVEGFGGGEGDVGVVEG